MMFIGYFRDLGDVVQIDSHQERIAEPRRNVEEYSHHPKFSRYQTAISLAIFVCEKKKHMFDRELTLYLLMNEVNLKREIFIVQTMLARCVEMELE